jgi:hypothetical protein
VDRQEWIEEIMKPEALDTMIFELKATDPNPEHTFSMDSVYEVIDNAKAFVMGRIVGNIEKTGKVPRHSRVIITFQPYADDFTPVDELEFPFYMATITHTQSVVDAEHRLRALDK